MPENNPQIGKDVIESLTLGMYEDCRFIYREYIQNAADQVDKAIDCALLENNSSLKFEMKAKQFYAASQRVLWEYD